MIDIYVANLRQSGARTSETSRPRRRTRRWTR